MAEIIINKRFFDYRTTDRYLEKGLMKPEDLAKRLKALPDEANNAQWVQMDLHDAEISEEDTGSDEGEEGV